MTSNIKGNDAMDEACGVFGVYAPGRETASLTYYALFALQHRGQESAGIANSEGNDIRLQRGMGLVSEIFTDLASLGDCGSLAIGHVRYSTTGDSSIINAQPLVFRFREGKLAIAHNGNLVNAAELRKRLEQDGSIFQTTTDSELIAHLVARYGHDNLEKSLPLVLPYIHGAYAFLLMTPDTLIGLRDPLGIRPLSLGKIENGGWVLASETCAFDSIGAEFVRDVEPGEMVVIDKSGLRSITAAPKMGRALCIFEYIYFSRPDSNLGGENVHLVRRRMGRQLAKEHPSDADLVMGVPDSSVSAASAYAEELNLPYEIGLIKNRYIGRTFIKPTQEQRELGVKIKLNPVRQIIDGKRVVLVDDSIVRGTTSRQLISMLRGAGAKEVHLRVASPPVRYSCFYGIDTSTRKELIATGREIEDIRGQIGADSLGYLSLEGMLSCFKGEGFCKSCFDGNYPV